MALQAKFLKVAKAGALAIYEVRGTSTELNNFVVNNYKDREPAFKSSPDGKLILDQQGNKVPLLFTAYPMPNRTQWYPLYQTLTGPNAGNFSLDKAELQFDQLLAKSLGSNLGDQIASKMAEKYTSSAPISSTLAALDDEEEDEDEVNFTDADESAEEVASEDATMDVVETTTKAKTNK
jgi:hypothetical protein